MALMKMPTNAVGGGSGNGVFGTLIMGTDYSANENISVDCGFEPSQIIIVETQSSTAQWTFIYDKDYSTVNCRYVGSSNSTVRNWTDFAMSGASASSANGFTEVNSTGFKFHVMSTNTPQRLDYIAVK